MDTRGIFHKFSDSFSLLYPCQSIADLLFIISSILHPSQNRNQRERSFLFRLLRNPAYSHQSLQSDRLLQYSLGCLALHSDKERFLVLGNPSAPVPVVYAVSFSRPVIYFPYTVLLSHRLFLESTLTGFWKEQASPISLSFCLKWNCLITAPRQECRMNRRKGFEKYTDTRRSAQVLVDISSYDL